MPYRGSLSDTGTNDTPSAPVTGIQVGDIAFMFILATASSATVTQVPTGWELMMERSPSGFKLWVYKRVWATGADTAPFWRLSQNTGWIADHWFGPGDNTPTVVGGDNTGSTALALSSNVVTDGSTLISYRGVDTGTTGQGRTWTLTGTPTPSGQTERVDGPATTAYRVLADEVLTATAGTSISRTGTVTGAATPISGFQILLPPVAAVVDSNGFFFGAL